MSDWLDELENIRKDDEAKHKKENIKPPVLSSHEQAVNALKACDAHNLLRRMQNVLLLGKGLIDIFDRTNEYDRAITLVWQGPISKARIPNTEDSAAFQYIMVGANGSKVFVNGRPIKSNTPEILKKALVWAAKNPKKQASK
jgi:hypothetical protein